MKKLSFLTLILALFTGIMFTQSCKKSTPVTPVAGPTLYDSLGGTALVADPANPGTMIEKGRLGIRSVVDSAIFVIAADNRINGHFTVLLAEVTSGNTSGYIALTNNLTDFFCVATGAKDFTYGGKSMTDAHNPATNNRMNGKASAADFSAFVSDVVVGAQQVGVPDNLINSVGVVMSSVQGQVVQQ